MRRVESAQPPRPCSRRRRCPASALPGPVLSLECRSFDGVEVAGGDREQDERPGKIDDPAGKRTGADPVPGPPGMSGVEILLVEPFGPGGDAQTVPDRSPRSFSACSDRACASTNSGAGQTALNATGPACPQRCGAGGACGVWLQTSDRLAAGSRLRCHLRRAETSIGMAGPFVVVMVAFEM